MARTIKELKSLEHSLDLARLRGLRPIDDDFMRCIFRDNIPLVQLVLRILTNIDDLVITKLEIQKDLKRLLGARSICLDAYGIDSKGRIYNLEIQRWDHGFGVRRARFHSSSMDIENLDASQDFDELPETYTIILAEKDFFGKGCPFYPIERVNLATNELFNDGEHILYVNGEYRDDSEIGKLMHDFSCWNPDEMNYDLMKDAAKYYKETPEGVAYMCRTFEEIRKEGIEQGIEQGIAQGIEQGIQQGIEQGIQQGIEQGIEQGAEQARIDSIRNLMDSLKMTAQQAMEVLKIPASEQSAYAAKL